MTLALCAYSNTSRLSVSNSDAVGGPYGGLLTTRKTDILGKQWVTTGLLKENGAPTRTRTADLLITNQLLYQLSYRGTVRVIK